MGLDPAASTAAPPLGAAQASSTAEMLAALPDGLMTDAAAGVGERRISDVLVLYRAIFLNSTDPIAIIDSTGQYLEQNVAHQALLGYTAAELQGKTPAIHLGDETFASIVFDLDKFGQTRREVVSRTKDGRLRVIDLSAFAVRDRAGKALCYVGIKRDVTDHRNAAASLQRRFEELKAVHRLTEALARAADLPDIYEEAIDGLLLATRADRASVLLFDGDGVMRFKASRRLSAEYRAAVEGHSPWTRDTRHPQPVTVANVATDPHLGGLAPAILAEGIHALAFVPLMDDGGALLGKFMLYFDAAHDWQPGEIQLATTVARHVSFAIMQHRRITQLSDAAREQQRLYAEADQANRTKAVFLATMSHELRTPLNAIAGYTDLLDAGIHGELAPPQRDAVQRIQANQRHLLRLIDDVLDFAKLEAGHLDLEIASVPVQETIDGTRAIIETQLQTKGLTFVSRPGSAATTCRADRAKMQQVLVNLLSNAWKFTPAGGTVTLEWEQTGTEIRIHVRDTGPGIPAQSLDTIFQPFVQLHSGFRRKVEGTGLGLAIARELARGMGGDVRATSVLGQGSTFTLVLPR